MSYRWPGRSLLAGALCIIVGAGLCAQAAPWPPRAAGELPSARIIVKWRDQGVAAVQIEGTVNRAARLSASTGIHLTAMREIHDRLDLMRLPTALAGADLMQVIARLRADPSVQYAEVDARRYALAYPVPPNDPRFIAGTDANGDWLGQWYLNDSSSATPAAIGATTAWQTSTGASFVVAVLDTGVDFTHPDLGRYGAGGKLLPGFDFICNDSGMNCSLTTPSNSYLVANDGDGWDSDPTDPGDWISTTDLARSDHFFSSCGTDDFTDHHVDSNWHGTRVAGVIGAITNNGVGIAGVAPDAFILPVRVIGKCHGYLSDIVSGMYWAAGLTSSSLAGIATNLNPAPILNLSFGGIGPCSQTEQDAVNALSQAGHLVVVAAGNDGGPLSAPANCQGVLAVAGLRHVGTKVGYSNVSSTAATVGISAPAGNCVNINPPHVLPWTQPCLYSIETTSNDGLTTPGNPFYTYALFNAAYGGTTLIANEGNVGTSFAAPIVAGVAALMVQANRNFTVQQLIARMQAAATPFPIPATSPPGGVCHVAALTLDATGQNYTDVQNAECQCTTSTCGAGMVNAAAAVGLALKPLASIITSTDTASVGESVTLDGSTSIVATGRTIHSYQWSVDPAIAIENASAAIAKIVFPALRPITVTLTVTDDVGRQDQASKTINSVALSAGGGRGTLAAEELLALAGAAALAFLRRQNRAG
ncbi:MAG TPA: S8 family serine peptidase [Steroidobacteraceae bacterium]